MRLVMMGTGTFAEPTFQALLASTHQVVGLVTQPERKCEGEPAPCRIAHHGAAPRVGTLGEAIALALGLDTRRAPVIDIGAARPGAGGAAAAPPTRAPPVTGRQPPVPVGKPVLQPGRR